MGVDSEGSLRTGGVLTGWLGLMYLREPTYRWTIVERANGTYFDLRHSLFSESGEMMGSFGDGNYRKPMK